MVTPQSNPDLQHKLAALHNDDLSGWREINAHSIVAMDAWLKANVVHAIESCPRVMAHWRKNQADTPFAIDKLLCKYLGAALEHLDDQDKTKILKGDIRGNAQAVIFHHLNDSNSDTWAAFSPAWSGAPNGPLRDAAEQKGWTPRSLEGQVAHSISRPAARVWAKWVPYAQSVTAIYRLALIEWIAGQLGEPSKILREDEGQAWASPLDMALAMSLARRRPEALYVFHVHPKAAPISGELQDRMDALVLAHSGLGLMQDLHDAIFAGHLPDVETREDVVLPPLDD